MKTGSTARSSRHDRTVASELSDDVTMTNSAVDEEDFRREVFWAVQEGAFLFEVPRGATDLLPSGPVVHGPWDPAACSTALLTWVRPRLGPLGGPARAVASLG